MGTLRVINADTTQVIPTSLHAKPTGELISSIDEFTGVGGLTSGLQQYMHSVAYCECHAGAQQILRARTPRELQ